MQRRSGTDWILGVLTDVRDAAREGRLDASAEALDAAIGTFLRETAEDSDAQSEGGSGMGGPADP